MCQYTVCNFDYWSHFLFQNIKSKIHVAKYIFSQCQFALNHPWYKEPTNFVVDENKS